MLKVLYFIVLKCLTLRGYKKQKKNLNKFQYLFQKNELKAIVTNKPCLFSSIERENQR